MNEELEKRYIELASQEKIRQAAKKIILDILPNMQDVYYLDEFTIAFDIVGLLNFPTLLKLSKEFDTEDIDITPFEKGREWSEWTADSDTEAQVVIKNWKRKLI